MGSAGNGSTKFAVWSREKKLHRFGNHRHMNQHDDSDLHKQTIVPLAQRWQAVIGRQPTTRMQPLTANVISLPAAGSLHARVQLQAPVARALRQAGQESEEGETQDVGSRSPAGSLPPRVQSPMQVARVARDPAEQRSTVSEEPEAEPSPTTSLRIRRRAPIGNLPERMQTQPNVARALQQMSAEPDSEVAAEPHSAGTPAGDSPQLARRDVLAAVQTMQSVHHPRQRKASTESLEETNRAGVLDARIQGMLAGMLNLRLPAVKVQADAQADAVARGFAADAVAYHDRILFRAGRFAPHTPAGLALLGHELTHIAAAHGQPIAQPGARGGGDAEEAAALHNEARVIQHFAAEPAMPRYPVSPTVSALASPTTTGNQPGPGPVAAPKTALSTRTLPGDGSPQRTSTPDLSPQQLKFIKDAVYRDILDRIRTDFERGA